MPATIKADWKLAEQLYTSGVARKKIAETVGVAEDTLKMRIHRQKWGQRKQELVNIAGNILSALPERAKNARQKLAGDVERSIDSLLKHHSPQGLSLKQFAQRENIATAIQKRAFETFGISDHAQDARLVRVDISFTAPVPVDPKPAQVTECATPSTPPIDITSISTHDNTPV